MTIDRANETMDRLKRFEQLKRKATDEAGWIALAYSASRQTAEEMIQAARAKLKI